MGFGIILLGYLLTLLDSFGGGILGYPLMAYGFTKVSKINMRFGLCAIISIISAYEPALQVLAILKVVDPTSAWFTVCHVVSYIVKLSVIITFYFGIIEVARDSKSLEFESKARLRLSLNCFACVVVIFATSIGQNQAAANIANIAYYVICIMNILFIWDCASKITTREQMRIDNEKIRRIDAEEKRKAEKRKKNK